MVLVSLLFSSACLKFVRLASCGMSMSMSMDGPWFEAVVMCNGLEHYAAALSKGVESPRNLALFDAISTCGHAIDDSSPKDMKAKKQYLKWPDRKSVV